MHPRESTPVVMWRLGGLVLVSVLFGLLTNLSNDWDVLDGERLFLSDLVFPYLWLPFAAGALAPRRAAVAAAAGVVVVMAAFAGYYYLLFSRIGAPLYLLLSPGNPWVPFEVLAGVTFGWLGHRWRWHRSARAGAACAVLPALEAVLTASGVATLVGRLPLGISPPAWPYGPWNLTFWTLEILAAAVALLAVMRVVQTWTRVETASATRAIASSTGTPLS